MAELNDYNVCKCAPEVLEDVLKDNGKKGWKLSFMTGEQNIHALTGKQHFVYVIIFIKPL
jgi:hypothetical protein